MLENYTLDRNAERVNIAEIVLPVISLEAPLPIPPTRVTLSVKRYNEVTGEPYMQTLHYNLEDLKTRRAQLQAELAGIEAVIEDSETEIASPQLGVIRGA
jgi:hypothetical protein